MALDDLYIEGDVREDGTLFIDDDDLKAALVRGGFAGKRVILRVQRWTRTRSIVSNNFYFGVIVKSLAEYTGHTKDEVHEILKARFAHDPYYVVNEKTGEITVTEVPRSTKRMTQPEFSAFIDSCIQLCTDLGIQLPAYGGDIYER